MKVSVVMITYSHERFIKEAVMGVLNQKCNFDVELLIANDNSPDTTDEIIQKIIAENNTKITIRYFKREQNIGMIPNLVDVLSRVSGEYIAICDGDDKWSDKLKLQKQVEILDINSDIGLVYTDINHIDENSAVSKKNVMITNEYSYVDTFEDYLIISPFRATCTWVFRKTNFKLEVFNDSNMIGDLSILLDVAKTSKIYFLNEVTAHYRILESSASHFKDKRLNYIFNQKVLKTQLYFAENQNQISTLILNFARNNFRNYLQYGSTNKHYFLDNAKKFPLVKRLLIYIKTLF